MRTLSDYNRALFANREFNAAEPRLAKALVLLRSEQGGHLLDVAAGDGIAARLFRDTGWNVDALEISNDLTQSLRKQGFAVTQHDLATGSLPYKSGSFEALFAGEIIEHLIDTDGFFAEVRRVLRPDGVAVVTTPNLASFENRVRLLLGIYPKWVDFGLSGEGHVRSYTLPVLCKQLARNGFVVEQAKGNWVPLLPQRFIDDVRHPWISWTGNLFPRLSQGLIVKARRPAGH